MMKPLALPANIEQGETPQKTTPEDAKADLPNTLEGGEKISTKKASLEHFFQTQFPEYSISVNVVATIEKGDNGFILYAKFTDTDNNELMLYVQNTDINFYGAPLKYALTNLSTHETTHLGQVRITRSETRQNIHRDKNEKKITARTPEEHAFFFLKDPNEIFKDKKVLVVGDPLGMFNRIDCGAEQVTIVDYEPQQEISPHPFRALHINTGRNYIPIKGLRLSVAISRYITDSLENGLKRYGLGDIERDYWDALNAVMYPQEEYAVQPDDAILGETTLQKLLALQRGDEPSTIQPRKEAAADTTYTLNQHQMVQVKQMLEKYKTFTTQGNETAIGVEVVVRLQATMDSFLITGKYDQNAIDVLREDLERIQAHYDKEYVHAIKIPAPPPVLVLEYSRADFTENLAKEIDLEPRETDSRNLALLKEKLIEVQEDKSALTLQKLRAIRHIAQRVLKTETDHTNELQYFLRQTSSRPEDLAVDMKMETIQNLATYFEVIYPNVMNHYDLLISQGVPPETAALIVDARETAFWKTQFKDPNIVHAYFPDLEGQWQEEVDTIVGVYSLSAHVWDSFTTQQQFENHLRHSLNYLKKGGIMLLGPINYARYRAGATAEGKRQNEYPQLGYDKLADALDTLHQEGLITYTVQGKYDEDKNYVPNDGSILRERYTARGIEVVKL